MRVTLTEKYAAFVRVVLLAVIVALVPWPAAAGDGASTAKHPAANNHQSLRAAVAREASRVPLARATTRHDDQGSTTFSSFFKSRPGEIALVVMAIGGGYAIYSSQHDRIKSPGKK